MKEGMFEAPRSPEIYFSVAHLVRHVIVRHEDGTSSTHTIALKGKDLPDGRMRFQAIGGGAKLTDAMLETLRSDYGNEIEFRAGEEADDARFTLKVSPEIFNDDTERNNFVHQVLDPFVKLDPAVFEADATREIAHELPLSKEELEHVVIKYVGPVSPIQWTSEKSGRGAKVDGYYRLFHLSDVVVDEATFASLTSSGDIKVLSDHEISQINEATKHGEAMTELADGSVVVENVFPHFDSKN